MRKRSDFELVESQGGKYALVVGVTKRAKQLNDGARPLVERRSLNSVATAIEELAQGRTKIIPPRIVQRRSPLREIPVEALDGTASVVAPVAVAAEAADVATPIIDSVSAPSDADES